MKKRAVRTIGKPAAKRLAGLNIGLIRAQAASAVVGVAAAVATYRLLRSGS